MKNTTHVVRNEHIFYTVTSPTERTAAYRLGVNVGKGRFWFTRSNWNEFVEEVQQADKQQKEGNE